MVSHVVRACVRALVVVHCVAAIPAGSFAAQDPAPPADRAATLERARAALLRGEAAAARTLLDAALATDAAWIDARTLRAFACVAAGDDAAAIADFTELARLEPTSPSGLEARFGLAQRLFELDRHAEASAVTADAVTALCRQERRHALASIYARTAAELLRPKATTPGLPAPLPEYAKALPLLQLAEGLGALGTDAPAVSLDVLRCMHALGQDPTDAVRRAQALRAAAPASNDLAEIDYLEGHARARLMDSTGALLAWRRAATDPAQPFAARALEDAAMKFLNSAEFPRMTDAAVDVAEDMLARLPTHERTPHVVLDVVRRSSELEPGSARALQLMDVFVRTYADHALLADAIELQDELLVEQGRPDEGALRLSAFLAARPADAKSRPIANRLADRRFGLAQAASSEVGGVDASRRQGAIAAARARWNDFLAAYPLDVRAADAAMSLAALDVVERAFDAALERYADIRKRFPGEVAAHRAALEAARILADEKGAFDAAFALLAEIPVDSAMSAPARQLADAWRAVELELASSTLAPGVAGQLTLHLRNLESATIAIYRVRADDVFTAHGSVDALGSIDVTLVTPERSFECKADGYTPYRRLDVPVPLPAEPASTTLVVTARAGDHEARAVALFSNTAFAAVVSREAIEPIVFDRTTGAPIESATVRAAFDGVASDATPPTVPTNGFATVGLFARSAAGDSFAAVPSASLPAVPTLDAAATLLPEAPMYAPGDTIHVFGIVRAADGGKTVPWPADGSLRWVWVDDGQQWVDSSVAAIPTAEGFVRGSFDVPHATNGVRTIVCRLEHERAGAAPQVLGAASFTIAPPVTKALTVTWENEDGSPARLTAGVSSRTILRVRSRQPMPSTEVRLRLLDDAESRHLTDELGRVIVPIDGTRTTHAERVRLTATVLGESFSFDAPVVHPDLEWFLARDASNAFVAGEPGTLRVIADVADGASGAGARARLTIRRVSASARGPALATQDLVADATGRAEVAFTPTEPGAYVAWIEWTHPDGTLKTTSIGLEAFGPTSQPGLQILPVGGVRAHGDTVALRVFAALDAGPALFVTHGRRLQTSQVVRLEPGWNTVSIRLPELPASRCSVAARAVRGGVTYAASATIRLEAPLRIALTVDGATPRRASASVTDATGKPAAADVAYWLVRDVDANRLVASLQPATKRGLDDPGTTSVLAFDGDLTLPRSHSTVDSTVERALREIASADRADSAPVLVDALALQELARNRPLIPGEVALQQIADDDLSEGHAGGTYGARGGGKAKKNRQTLAEPDPALLRPALARKLDARTDTDGRSTWELPAQLEPGSYAIVAVASAGATRVAVARTAFVVVTDVDVRVDAPSRLTAADRSRVRIELESRSDAPRSIALELETTLSDAPVRATVELGARAGKHVTLALPALRNGVGVLRVRAAGSTFERPLTVLPNGVPMTASVGATDAAERATLTLSDGTPIDLAELVLDGGAPAALLSLAEESDSGDVAGDLRATAARLLTEIEALRATQRYADAAAARRDPIRIRTERRLHRLAWWSADPQSFDPLLAYAVARAPLAGLTVPDALRARVDAAITERLGRAGSDTQQAWLLFCRGTATDQDFGRVNRLVRAKARLDVAALALLSNALATSDMKAEALDVFAELRARLAPGRPAPEPNPFAWVDAAEVAALALDTARTLALDAAEIAALAAPLEATASPAIGDRLARVLALRSEVSPEGKGAPAGSRFEARSGDAVLATLVDAEPWRSARIALPSDRVAAGVQLARSGSAVGARARLAQTRAFALERLPLVKVDAQHRFWRVDEIRDGVRVRVGDTVLRAPTRRLDWNQPVTLAVTRRVQLLMSPTIETLDAETSWWFVPRVEGLTFDVGYGALRVLRDPRGTWFEVATPAQPNTTVQIDVTIAADQPGTYAMPTPLLARNPTRFDARPKSGGPSVVTTDAPDAGGEGPAWTPDERLDAARAAFSRDDRARASELLAPLLDAELEADPARDVNRMALLCAVDANDAPRMVQCFEFAKERDPDFVVPFAATASVARAYRTLHEHERARQVDLALAEAGFLEEAQIVGALEQVGRALEATRVMVRLLREAPDTELVRQTAFALAQRAAQHARSPGAVPDPTSFAA
ncbi:MAG: hypothetical protein JNL94_10785, partial [Planctomycetes bacterium]|nr:hypothetical protein [Planctomycetota bacterium]